MPAPRIAIGPHFSRSGDGAPEVSWAVDAVRDGGGEPVGADVPDVDGLVWLDATDPEALRLTITEQRRLRWVQLPFAGIERIAHARVLDPRLLWTCAKGAYAEPVAEHALALALTGLRRLPSFAAATTWGREAGTSLYDRKVTILGGGGITEELLRLLAPFRVEATVVRRRADPVAGAARTVSTADLHDVLPGALVVFLALALTPDTTGIIGARELELMDRTAWLVNVARGAHVDTGALVEALASGDIAGAAIDVTDPEPLPDGHPLWSEPRCLVTPHTADTWEMVLPLLSERIRTNVARFATGQPLEGVVDPAAGY